MFVQWVNIKNIGDGREEKEDYEDYEHLKTHRTWKIVEILQLMRPKYTVRKILTEYLEIRKISAKMSTKRISIFLTVVTEDETWCFHYD